MVRKHHTKLRCESPTRPAKTIKNEEQLPNVTYQSRNLIKQEMKWKKKNSGIRRSVPFKDLKLWREKTPSPVESKHSALQNITAERRQLIQEEQEHKKHLAHIEQIRAQGDFVAPDDSQRRCSKCGIETYRMVECKVVNDESVKHVLVSKPITDDMVFKGRCTLCFPLPPGYSGHSRPKNSERSDMVLDKSHVNDDCYYEGNLIMNWFSCR
mmetsp:Transcript_2942/g.4507  ORF Transcript_2942/g.4507 Transcript_2942/m.4507 type:complete len:211 (-) Transcript_2942:173-805(-)